MCSRRQQRVQAGTLAAFPGTRVHGVSRASGVTPSGRAALERLASHIAAQLVGHYRIDSITDVGQLETAVRAIGARHGPIDRCFGAYEQLQVPIAIVRERLGIKGLSSTAATNFRDKARMKDVLRAAGVPVARHRLIGSVESAEAFAREVGFPIVIKPPAGAGAIAIWTSCFVTRPAAPEP